MSFSWRSCCLSDIGNRRRRNEDSFLESPCAGVWVVADGMGGHVHGDLASRIVADTFAGIVPGRSLDDLVSKSRSCIEIAHAHIRTMAYEAGATMGTTVVALMLHRKEWACLWVGDSRAYRIRRGRLEQLSRDHSVVQELIDRGVGADDIDPLLANRITRAVGATVPLQIAEVRGSLCGDEVFLLCSDGLVREVPDDDLQAALGGRSCDAAARLLIDLALERGGRDNVTVAVVAVEAAPD